MTDSLAYCLKTLAFTGLGLGLLGAFNAVVDPYQLLGTKSIQSLNARKTEIFFQLPVTKPYQFYSGSHSNIILGSSRAGRAIDPDHAAIRSEGYYNFATPGATPEMDYLKLKSAVSLRAVGKVIYFVDFFTFNAFYAIPASSTDAFRRRMSLRGPAWSQPLFLLQALRDYSSGFWSYQTFRDSVATIGNQHWADAGKHPFTELYENGLWHFAFVADRKPMNAFNLMEGVYLRDTWFSPGSRRFSLRESEETPNRPFFYFQSLLALAHDSGVSLDIVMLPLHARLLDALDYAGLWENFENWKRQLVAINAEVAQSRIRVPFPLWDFNGYYPEIIEPITDDTKSSDLEWFYDSAHTHIDTGGRILSYITGRSDATFGGRVHPGNIERWLEEQRSLKHRYRVGNEQATEDVRLSVDKLMHRLPAKIDTPPTLELEVDELRASKHAHD